MVEHMFKNTPQQREADVGANALAEIGKTAKKVLRNVCKRWGRVSDAFLARLGGGNPTPS